MLFLNSILPVLLFGYSFYFCCSLVVPLNTVFVSFTLFSFVLFCKMFSIFCRYYRANSVRYPTPPCEGVCALNHYCAITRVDYHEFRHCLESAASALASSSARPNICIPIAANIALLLATYTIMKCQQRQLLVLFEWLQFLVFDLMIGVLIVKCIKCTHILGVAVADKLLPFRWKNERISFESKSTAGFLSLLTSILHTISRQRKYNRSLTSTALALPSTVIIIYFDFIRNTHNYLKQMFQRCVKISMTIVIRLKQFVQVFNQIKSDGKSVFYNEPITVSTTTAPIPSPTASITSMDATKQYQLPVNTSVTTSSVHCQCVDTNCKLCQIKLFTNLDSFNQTRKPIDFIVKSKHFFKQNNTNNCV